MILFGSLIGSTFIAVKKSSRFFQFSANASYFKTIPIMNLL